MRPSAMATSTFSWISAVHTFTSFAPLITVSAGASPWATADRVVEHSHSGFLQNLLIMPRSFDERRRLFGAGSIRSLSALLKLPSTIPF